MNFTREPIIETVITPREGCTLVVRSSKGAAEEYYVEALEVVSFGQALFFRSQERPKSFLVPVSDYEVVELKEARMALKNAALERSVKIGGGRESRPEPSDAALSESRPAPMQESRSNKRDKRRRGHRGRDGRDSREPRHPHPTHEPSEERSHEPPAMPSEEASQTAEFTPSSGEKAPSFISKLFPPPPTLIKESLTRYKPEEEEHYDAPPVVDEDDNEE